MPKTYDRRLAEVEQQCLELSEEIKVLRKQLNLDNEWVSVAEAARLLPDQSEGQIRARIREARENPSEALFVYGIHWRGHNRFHVHLKNWQKKLEELWNNE